ncbi:MAG: PAS domain S-box protein [Chloroflexi bacterium]|nr:PAS domain S-box protein [Chloroflexota bacterium]MBV9895053.1 PAS domain S-box protein [Chloroflexota bacterium]
MHESEQSRRAGAGGSAISEQEFRPTRGPHDSDECNRLLIEGVTDFAIVLVSPEGIVASWNRGAKQLTGYDTDQILGKPLEYLHTSGGRLAGQPAKLLEKARTEQCAHDIGWRVRADGTRFWADETLSALNDDRGEVSGFAVVIRDAGDRKRAEEALSNQAEHLAQIIAVQSRIAQQELDGQKLMEAVVQHMPELTNASAAVVELVDGEDMVYAAGSGTVANYIGLRLKLEGSFSGLCVRTDRVLLSSDTEIDPRVDRTATRKVGARSMIVAPLKYEGRVVGALKVMSPRPEAFDGRHIATLELMAGVLGGALGHAQAFADRTRAEAQARAAAERFGAVLRAATEVSIIGIGLDGRVIFFNEGAERMLGYRASEMIGRTPEALMDMDEVRARASARDMPPMEVLVNAARQGGAQTDEWTYIRKDGSRLTVLLTVTAMHGDNGALVGFVGIAIDISARKAVEEMKDQFVSLVSHELRTPLTSIRGSLGLLAGGLVGGLPERGQRMVDIALENTERLLRLINDILDLERMQSGRIQMERVETDLGSLMSKSAEVMRAMAEQADVRLEAQPLSAAIYADPDRIIQVLTNLLSNAIKFSSREAEVTLRGLECGDGRLRLEVQDHGRGIPPDYLERVFERFEQVKPGDARDKGGTGLGLPICRTIVEQHGGRIWAESTPGLGTTMVVELPSSISRHSEG